MIRKPLVLLTISVIFSLASLLISPASAEAADSELPAYGGIPFSPEEQQANTEFINTVVKISGNREAAFEATLGEAWSRYERRDYRTAMRRFNQAWLLDSNNSDVFRGFACVLFATGKKAESVIWDRKAAEMGNVKSQNNLAAAYFDAKDYKQAVEWYRKAAEQGHMIAQYQLGVAYEEGKGVELNLVEAVMWYQRAAQQGYVDAKKRLLKLRLKNILHPTPH